MGKLLYHFTDKLVWGEAAIQSQRLKIATINRLNDPFEFNSFNLPRGERRAFRAWKNEMDKRYGLICFSRSWHSTLQWAHYGGKHGGVCLEYEVLDPTPFRDITYISQRPEGRQWEEMTRLANGEAIMEDLLFTKHISWKYEEETRAFLRLDPDCIEDGLYFWGYAGTLKLKRLLLGCMSTATRKDLKAALHGFPDVEVIKTRPAFQNFQIVQQRRWRINE